MHPALPAILATAFLAGCTAAVGPEGGHAEAPPSCGDDTLHVAADGAYGFCVPRGWELQEGLMGREWFALSPATEGDTFRENLNLGRIEGKGAPPIGSLVDDIVREMEAGFDRFELQDLERASLGSVEGRAIHYAATAEGADIEGVQVVADAGAEVYILTFTRQPGMDLHDADAERAQASFRFLR
jgi:hypothetical protein